MKKEGVLEKQTRLRVRDHKPEHSLEVSGMKGTVGLIVHKN